MWILEITLPKELIISHSIKEKHPGRLFLVHSFRRSDLYTVFVSDLSFITDFAQFKTIFIPYGTIFPYAPDFDPLLIPDDSIV